MTTADVLRYAAETYHSEPEYLWARYPDYAVLRHRENKKWYALLAPVPRHKLGLDGAGSVDILNIKCDPDLIAVLLAQPGFFRAYHMNKRHWLTIALDGSAAEQDIRSLLDLSYALTKGCIGKPKTITDKPVRQRGNEA